MQPLSTGGIGGIGGTVTTNDGCGDDAGRSAGVQALVGDDLKAAYLSSGTKQERAAAVGPLWERARSLLVGCPSPAASSPVDGSEPEVLDALAVNKAMKVRRCRRCCAHSAGSLLKRCPADCPKACCGVTAASLDASSARIGQYRLHILGLQRVEAGIMRRLVTQDNFRADGRSAL